MAGPLLVADGPYLAYRAYFSLPDSITGPDGRPVNALLGTVNALLLAIEEHRPRAVICCLGAESAGHRTALVPSYHANRPPMPDPLADQLGRLDELLEPLGVSCLDAGGLEADDLMASLAVVEAAAGGRTLLMTADRDLFGAVDEHTAVLLPSAGGKPPRVVGPAEVLGDLGVAPGLIGDLKALAGDPSDNLPGAPGIGPKTAATLLAAYGDLDGVLGAAATATGGSAARGGPLTPAKRGALRDHADAVRAQREAIRLVVDPDVERPPDRPLDLVAGAQAARRLGLGALARRLDPDRAAD